MPKETKNILECIENTRMEMIVLAKKTLLMIKMF